MKKILLFSALSAIFFSCQYFNKKEELKKSDLKDFKAKYSYMIGIDIGRNLKEQDIEIDLNAFMQGIKDAQKNDTLALLSNQELYEIAMQLNMQLQQKMAEKQNEIAEKNIKEQNEFFEKNKTKPGVKTTESGIQYEILASGKGKSPKASDKVKVHYRGFFINGDEFDSSYKRGEPAVFQVDKVIKGWTEILQIMKVGDKFRVYIPSHLAYGEEGRGNAIEPNKALIFEIELLGIE